MKTLKEYINHDTRRSIYYLPGKCIQSSKSMLWKTQSQAIGMVVYVRSYYFYFCPHDYFKSYSSGNDREALIVCAIVGNWHKNISH